MTELVQNTTKTETAKQHFEEITRRLIAYIQYLGFLSEQGKEIQLSTEVIDQAVVQLAAHIEETTATTENLVSLVDEAIIQITGMLSIIEETNQTAAGLEASSFENVK